MTEKIPEEEKESKPVISYHTFMFPFLFEMNKKMTRGKFEACCHPGWFPDVWEPDAMKAPIWYNQYHYFNEATQNAIYMPKDFKDNSQTVVKNLRFDLLSLTEENPKANPLREMTRQRNENSQIQYVIRKDKDYYLDVNAIRMKLFNTGVGILIFELENRDYPSENDVKLINDIGRRIYAPYYAEDKEDKNRIFCTICAEALYFAKDKKNIAPDDDPSLIPKGIRAAADVTVLAKPIRQLLSNSNCHVTTNRNCAKNEICIEPIIDDRMFVACYYINGDFVDAMREWDGDRYRYMTDAKSRVPSENEKNSNTAHRLYTMMYVDSNGICCHGRDMLQKLLSDDHIYTRWLEYSWFDKKESERVFAGTITGFSEYTMISVAKNPPEHLINAFLTQYVEIAILVLAQRASLLAFEYMISECARGKHYEVQTIQKKYTLFQSQILLKEVSPQQQGIELYDLLKKNLMIEKEQSEIKEQISGLFEQNNFYHDAKENKILFLISMIGLLEAVNTGVDIFEPGKCVSLILKIILFFVSLIGIALFILLKSKKNK